MSRNPALWSVFLFLIGTGFSVSEYHSNFAAFAFWSAALILFFYAFKDWTRLPKTFRWHFGAFRVLSFSGMMPLHEVARIVYGEIRGTFLGKFVEKSFDTPDKLLCALAGYVANTSVPLFGKHPPSDRCEEIDKHVLTRGSFRAAATEFFYHSSRTPEFTELSVRKGDLQRVVVEIKRLNDGAEKELNANQKNG